MLADRYLVERLVGQGTSGRVFRAIDLATERTVALKEFVKRGGSGGFLRELGILFELRHPSILECESVFMAGPYRYLVYEYMEAGSLRDRLRSGTSPLAVLALLREAAHGVAHAHRRNVVHRDLKPENVLLTVRDGALRAKVSDFGISTLGTEEAERSAIGSPAYMAPEQFYDVYDSRIDVYALGVMAYEALCGCRPFYGSPAQIMRQHLEKPPLLPEWLPEGLRGVLARALAKDPDERFPSVEALVAALDAALEGEAGAIESAGWPARVEGVTELALTREAVLALSGRTLVRLDRRGRECERLHGVDELRAVDDHHVVRCGTSLSVFTPRGVRRFDTLPGGARVALSAEARVAVVSEGGAFVLKNRRRVRVAETGAGVTAATFVGPEQALALARDAGGEATLEVGDRRLRLPEPVGELWGHPEGFELVARSARDAARLFLVSEMGVRELEAPMGGLSAHGDHFVGATPAGELATLAVSRGRLARTRWEGPLAAAAGCVDGFAWATRDGRVLGLRS
ncbi:MAG: serine/threonine-protein kinase [Myxococcota bacterium]